MKTADRPPTDLTAGLFADFAAASSEVAPGTRDRLDEIEDWIRATETQLEVASAAIDSIVADFSSRFGKNYFPSELGRHCSFDELAKTAWNRAIREFVDGFVEPKGIKLRDQSEFVCAALGISEMPYQMPINFLSRWSAKKLREHFARTFGDVREAALRQLQEKALTQFGRKNQPTNPVRWWSGLHEMSFGSGRKMRSSYSRECKETFIAVVQYLIHLDSGKAVDQIVVPPILGFNDGEREWERSTLFKRQKNPFQGCRWMRFSASHGVEAELEPTVLVRLQAAWDRHHLR